MRLRVPGWLQAAPVVKINGRALEASAAPGSYLAISRIWKAGDRVEMEMPMHLHVEAMPDDAKTQAFLYGPLVLAGDLGTEGLTERMLEGPSAPSPQRVPMQVPVFRAGGEDPSSWIKPADKPLTFRTSGQPQDVTLVPINSLFGQRYSIYWQVG